MLTYWLALIIASLCTPCYPYVWLQPRLPCLHCMIDRKAAAAGSHMLSRPVIGFDAMNGLAGHMAGWPQLPLHYYVALLGQPAQASQDVNCRPPLQWSTISSWPVWCAGTCRTTFKYNLQPASAAPCLSNVAAVVQMCQANQCSLCCAPPPSR